MKKQPLEMKKNKSSNFKGFTAKSNDKFPSSQSKKTLKTTNLTILSKPPEESKIINISDNAKKGINSSRNKQRSPMKKSNISTNVNTLQSVRSSHNICLTSKTFYFDQSKDECSSYRKLSDKSRGTIDYAVEKDNYSVFSNTIEILNISDKFRKELELDGLTNNEAMHSILGSSSKLGASLYMINQRVSHNVNIDPDIQRLSEMRVREYTTIFDQCRRNLDKLKELFMDSIYKEKVKKHDSKKIMPLAENQTSADILTTSRRRSPQLAFQNTALLNYIHENSSELESSQQDKVGEEDCSQDIDINLKLDYTERIKNIPRSKIQAVRMEKAKQAGLFSLSQSPTNISNIRNHNFMTARTEMGKNNGEDIELKRIRIPLKRKFELDKVNHLIQNSSVNKLMSEDKNCAIF